MTSLLELQKPTYPQSFMLIYSFLFELWMLNLNEEEKKMKKSAHHSPIHHIYGGDSTTVSMATVKENEQDRDCHYT